jgi:hypothetical protein
MEYASLARCQTLTGVVITSRFSVKPFPVVFGLIVNTLLKPEEKRKNPEKLEGILGDGTFVTDVKCGKAFHSHEFRAVPARPSVEGGLMGR